MKNEKGVSFLLVLSCVCFCGVAGEVGRLGFSASAFGEGGFGFDLELEHVDGFDLDHATDTYAEIDPTYDASGNLTYDGEFAYTYDAWNRLTQATKAYRDGANGDALIEGAGYVAMAYDGVGRRITKTVRLGGDATGSLGDVDTSYANYYDGQQQIEVRDGSGNVIKQQVWGLMYIDELVQIAINDDPIGDGDFDLTVPATMAAAQFYYALHNANFNIMGLVDSAGNMKERYEYTPYGERQVFYSSGINDPLALTPRHMSQRVVTGTSPTEVTTAYALNEFGHQGLYHDEELGLVYNRARILHPRFGRFMQRDILQYVDGMSFYEYEKSNPLKHIDHSGNDAAISGEEGLVTHVDIYCDVRDDDGNIAGVLRTGFAMSEWWQVPLMFTNSQGLVTLKYLPNETIKSMLGDMDGYACGDADQDRKLVNWIKGIDSRIGPWLDKKTSKEGIFTYPPQGFCPTKGPWTTYRVQSQNCADFVDAGLDEYMGYNWNSWEVMTGPWDLIQQWNERYGKDGKRKKKTKPDSSCFDDLMKLGS